MRFSNFLKPKSSPYIFLAFYQPRGPLGFSALCDLQEFFPEGSFFAIFGILDVFWVLRVTFVKLIWEFSQKFWKDPFWLFWPFPIEVRCFGFLMFSVQKFVFFCFLLEKIVRFRNVFMIKQLIKNVTRWEISCHNIIWHLNGIFGIQIESKREFRSLKFLSRFFEILILQCMRHSKMMAFPDSFPGTKVDQTSTKTATSTSTLSQLLVSSLRHLIP